MPSFVNNTYSIEYDILKDNKASITAFRGNASELIVPELFRDDDTGNVYKVTEIKKKAFLGTKGLKSITLPSGINLVDDWAFSKCAHLEIISFLTKPSFGRAVFDGCNRLKKIYLLADRKENDEICENLSLLLAAAVNKFEAQYLLKDDDLGEEEWFKKWDLAFRNYLLSEDIDGYDDKALCGEEDISYDGINSVDGELLGDSGDYYNEALKNKCYLCILRLIHDTFLKNSDRELFENYILERSYEKEKPLAWKMLKEDVGEELEFLEKYIEITNPSNEILEGMIKDISADKANIRAFLIKCSKDRNTMEDDFFSQLLL